MTRDEILKILNDELPFLRGKYGINRIGLFGSYSRNQGRPDSDIDILVQFERPIGFFKFIAIEEYLSKRLGATVELVTEDALKPVIKPVILREVIYA